MIQLIQFIEAYCPYHQMQRFERREAWQGWVCPVKWKDGMGCISAVVDEDVETFPDGDLRIWPHYLPRGQAHDRIVVDGAEGPLPHRLDST